MWPLGSPVLPSTTRAYRLGAEASTRQTDQAAPVLTEEGDPVEIEQIDDQLAHPRHVAGIGVVAPCGRFVGAAEADEVGRHNPVTGGDEGADHAAVEVDQLGSPCSSRTGALDGPSSR